MTRNSSLYHTEVLSTNRQHRRLQVWLGHGIWRAAVLHRNNAECTVMESKPSNRASGASELWPHDGEGHFDIMVGMEHRNLGRHLQVELLKAALPTVTE